MSHRSYRKHGLVGWRSRLGVISNTMETGVVVLLEDPLEREKVHVHKSELWWGGGAVLCREALLS